jgi:hypothetical protein
MRRSWLIAAFVLLLALDVRAVLELWMRFLVHRHSEAVNQLTAGHAVYWTVWALVIFFDLGVLWLTIRVGRRLRSLPSIVSSN